MTETRWSVIVVIFAACVNYLPTINDYFTQDDFGVVQLLASKPWTTFPRWFTMPWMENIWGYTPDEIRPFVALTYQVTALPGPARPELHHLVNVLLHAGNALLVMAIAREAMRLSPAAAAFAAVVFALLPVQAESVAWITGRVDSMPAFFYLATFLAYVKWRQTSSGATWYRAALLLFFVALFSKQNTITMVATLAAYDLIVLPRARRGTLVACVTAWLPFALMTLGYLVLRRMLFGATVRGGIESRHQLVRAGDMIGRHLQRTFLGHTDRIVTLEWFALAILALALVVVFVRHPKSLRTALCFGPVWWIIGVIPVLVAGYESPRHVYLAAAGWAFMFALLLEAGRGLLDVRNSLLRNTPLLFVTVVIAVYGGRLHVVVRTWGSWAHVSKAAVERVGEEAATVEEGTLLLVSVPQKSWEWAIPFVLRPPYVSGDLSSRIRVVTPFRLYCCGPEQWDEFTRRQLKAWAGSPTPKPIVALHLAEDTAAVSRTTDAETPDLRPLVSVLIESDSWQTMDSAIVKLMDRVVRKPEGRSR